MAGPPRQKTQSVSLLTVGPVDFSWTASTPKEKTLRTTGEWRRRSWPIRSGRNEMGWSLNCPGWTTRPIRCSGSRPAIPGAQSTAPKRWSWGCSPGTTRQPDLGSRDPSVTRMSLRRFSTARWGPAWIPRINAEYGSLVIASFCYFQGVLC